MSPLEQSLIATFLVSAISLVGIVFIYQDWSKRFEIVSLSFAAGVLLGTTFLKLLPEAAAHTRDGWVFSAALVAIAAFFLLERFLHGFHEHEETHASPSRYLILIGDGLHNFIDGVAIGASFAVSPAVGIATTVAVAAHEIPQEVADYGILVTGGFGRWMALALNFLSSLSAIGGALACYAFEAFVVAHLGWFMTATAGMFIYIAASDLIPELHHARGHNYWLCVLPFFIAIAIMGLLAVLVPELH